MPALAIGALLLGGAAMGVTTIASAQSATTSNTPVVTSTGSTSDTQSGQTGERHRGHAPIGGDGIVSSVNGNTIIMAEEADEGSASYTVDASNASISVNGTAGTIASIQAGQKIFVQGTVNGTTVAATSISVGHPGGHGGGRPHDNDADDTTTGSTSSTNGQ